MRREPKERAGTVVVRAWMEVDGADGFRARVTQTPDLLHPESDTTTVATVAAACDLVRAFLDAFVAGTADPDPGPGDAAVTDR